jgi:L-threonylcarbamoyladenylate synthase
MLFVDLKSKTERLDARNGNDIARAAQILREGGTVAFPTETVYGLGANALSPDAVARIFAAKQRPSWDPLIVHIAGPAMLSQICLSFRGEAEESASPHLGNHVVPHVRRSFTASNMGPPAHFNHPETRLAEALMARFWPGPLTLLLPKTPAIPAAVTAGRPLVGVRMPNHPFALELIRQAGVPVAAPSANTFGHTSPTTAAHVLADLDGRIDAVLDGGPTSVGLESTVAGILPDEATGYPFLMVYREGAVTRAMLEAEIGAGAVDLYLPQPDSAPQSLPSPGVGIRHYAPRARLILVRPLEPGLVDAIDRAFDGIETIGVMLPDGWNPSCAQLIFPWGCWDNPEILAQRLYSGLRDLDDLGATTVVCPVPEGSGIAAAIRDRLQKAAR